MPCIRVFLQQPKINLTKCLAGFTYYLPEFKVLSLSSWVLESHMRLPISTTNNKAFNRIFYCLVGCLLVFSMHKILSDPWLRFDRKLFNLFVFCTQFWPHFLNGHRSIRHECYSWVWINILNSIYHFKMVVMNNLLT